MRFYRRPSAMAGIVPSYFLVKLQVHLSLGCGVESKAGSRIPTRYCRGISAVYFKFKH